MRCFSRSSIATIGENLQLQSVSRISVSDIVDEGFGHIGSYSHGSMEPGLGKAASIVVVRGSGSEASDVSELADGLAMQVVASAPLFLNESDVPAEALEKELELFKTQAAEKAKKPEFVEKIATGMLTKWKKEVCLVDQEYVIVGQDDKKMVVSKVLEAAGKKAGCGALDVVHFDRCAI